MRVFLDTNILVSALATRGICADLFEVVLQSHQLLTSEAVLSELERILCEKLGQSKSIATDFIHLIRTQAIIGDPVYPYPELPDTDDEVIVAGAIAATAEVFVTGDKALLDLQSVQSLSIVSPRNFWELLIKDQ